MNFRDLKKNVETLASFKMKNSCSFNFFFFLQRIPFFFPDQLPLDTITHPAFLSLAPCVPDLTHRWQRLHNSECLLPRKWKNFFALASSSPSAIMPLNNQPSLSVPVRGNRGCCYRDFRDECKWMLKLLLKRGRGVVHVGLNSLE